MMVSSNIWNQKLKIPLLYQQGTHGISICGGPRPFGNIIVSTGAGRKERVSRSHHAMHAFIHTVIDLYV